MQHCLAETNKKSPSCSWNETHNNNVSQQYSATNETKTHNLEVSDENEITGVLLQKWIKYKTQTIHANITERDAVDKLCLLSLCDVVSDCETLTFAEVGALLNDVTLNNLHLITDTINYSCIDHVAGNSAPRV